MQRSDLFMSKHHVLSSSCRHGNTRNSCRSQFIGDVGQSISFVRDITYWLSISGRTYPFLSGMICSEDILYFIIVISLFIILSIMRLQSARKRKSKVVTFARYFAVIGGALFIGYLTSLPISKFY